jgi:DNA-binding SARP family transcriptional activator
MTAYASRGELSKAAATYKRLVQGMQNDLGVKPSEQTQALYKALSLAGYHAEFWAAQAG